MCKPLILATLDAQKAFNVVYSCRKEYIIYNRYGMIFPSKSYVLTFHWSKETGEKWSTPWVVNRFHRKPNKTSRHTKRGTSQKNNTGIQDKTNLSRRTAYLLRVGFHSMNGLKQSVNGKLWSTYVIPRVLYGLQVPRVQASRYPYYAKTDWTWKVCTCTCVNSIFIRL